MAFTSQPESHTIPITKGATINMDHRHIIAIDGMFLHMINHFTGKVMLTDKRDEAQKFTFCYQAEQFIDNKLDGEGNAIPY